MAKYNYVCPVCGHTYIEQRGKDEPMYHPVCNACKSANYEEVK